MELRSFVVTRREKSQDFCGRGKLGREPRAERQSAYCAERSADVGRPMTSPQRTRSP